MSVKMKPVGTRMLMLLLVNIKNIFAAFGGVNAAASRSDNTGNNIAGIGW